MNFIFTRNRYSATYDRLMERARHREFIGYTEKHHLVPRALGGSNASTNIVRLTAREHLLAHQLLVRMTTGQFKYKMISALWAMCNLKSKWTVGRKMATTRQYETARIQFAQKLSETTRGVPKSAEHRAKIGIGNHGKVRSQETRSAISISKTGVSTGRRDYAQRKRYAASKTGAKNPAAKRCFVDNLQFDTISSAEKHFGVKRGGLKNRIAFT